MIGPISGKTHQRECSVARVRVDGVDVTNRCYAANDIEGWADCFVHNEHGRPFLLPECDLAVVERLTGDVVVDFPRELD